MKFYGYVLVDWTINVHFTVVNTLKPKLASPIFHMQRPNFHLIVGYVMVHHKDFSNIVISFYQFFIILLSYGITENYVLFRCSSYASNFCTFKKLFSLSVYGRIIFWFIIGQLSIHFLCHDYSWLEY